MNVDVMVKASVGTRSGLTEGRPVRAVGVLAIDPPDRSTCRENEDLAVAGQIVAEARRRRREAVGQRSARRNDGDGSGQSGDGSQRIVV